MRFVAGAPRWSSSMSSRIRMCRDLQDSSAGKTFTCFSTQASTS